MDDGILTTFETGATRGTSEGKIDLEGAFSVLAFERYGEYMLEHQTQSDGKPRASDNWQKGFPKSSLMKSLIRHIIQLWKMHRGWKKATQKELEDTLCAIIFNAQNFLHVTLVSSGTTPCDTRHGIELDDYDAPVTSVDIQPGPMDRPSVPEVKACRFCGGATVVCSYPACKKHCIKCSDHRLNFRGV